MAIDSISSHSAAALASVRPAGVDNDGDNDTGRETSESAAASAAEVKGPLATGTGRTVDISA